MKILTIHRIFTGQIDRRKKLSPPKTKVKKEDVLIGGVAEGLIGAFALADAGKTPTVKYPEKETNKIFKRRK